MTASICPACATPGLVDFYDQPRVPVNSLLLLDDAASARSFPTAPLTLAFCGTCGFVTNRRFDPAMTKYSADYEETQGFSPRFREFATSLARDWIGRYGLVGANVLEIGCGKGEFLAEMVRAGAGAGLGYDPVYRPGRVPDDVAGALSFRTANFDLSAGGARADAVVCRHTLEHIPDVQRFLQAVREVFADQPGTVLLFEVPDVQRILDEAAFWDVFYEHCSYFSAGSVARLFQMCGLEVLRVERVFDEQYLVIEARIGDGAPPARTPSPSEDDLNRLSTGVTHFQDSLADTTGRWRTTIEDVRRSGGRVVLWGSGSKSVSFLTTVGIDDEVEHVVDINPHKQGTYNAGTGQRIIAPEELVALDPALVVVMNPIYEREITEHLHGLGLHPQVRTL